MSIFMLTIFGTFQTGSGRDKPPPQICHYLTEKKRDGESDLRVAGCLCGWWTWMSIGYCSRVWTAWTELSTWNLLTLLTLLVCQSVQNISSSNSVMPNGWGKSRRTQTHHRRRHRNGLCGHGHTTFKSTITTNGFGDITFSTAWKSLVLRVLKQLPKV